jgi:hypothetical protein
MAGRVGGRERLLDRLVVAGGLSGGVGVGVTLVDVVLQRRAERFLGNRHLDPVLRALRAGQRRDDGGDVELELLGEARLDISLGTRVVPQALLLGVRLDELELLLGAAGHPQVVDGLLVDREDGDGRAELRAHVADRRAVGQRQRRDALAVELDELPDHAVLAEHLGDGQHEVGGGGALGQLAGELEADHARDQHGDRLAEHRGLGLDAADAPADHADAVDHRGVGVGADAGVGVGDTVADHHDAREVLDVDLVHDAGAGRDDLEVVEGALAPAQELVALTVALVLDLDVALERVGRAEHVGDDGVVDDHLGRRERVDPGGVAAELGHRLAHGGEVDDAGHAGEVLHDHARRRELDLLVGRGTGVPAGDRPDVVGRDVGAVLGAEQVLQEHLQREGQALDVEALSLDRVEPVDLVGLSVHVQGALGTEAVLTGHQPHLLGSSRVRAHLAVVRERTGRQATLSSGIGVS